MNEHFEKYLPIFFRIFMLCLLAIGAYFLCTTLIQYTLPFILGWLIASMIEPVINFLTDRFKLSRNIATFIVITGFVILIGSIIVLIGGIIIMELTALSIQLPEYSKRIYAYSKDLAEQMEFFYINLPSDIALSILKGFYTLLDNFTYFTGKFISSLLGFLSGVPNFLLFLVITIIATFFIARDKRQIKNFFIAHIPRSSLYKGRILKQDLWSALMGYVKAQVILMFITFVESSIGLIIIGLDYAVLIALIASIIDALPILGTGFVYIPLILFHGLSGHYDTAIHISILYGIIIVIRQVLEPKILGKAIGLYPLVTLFSMYVGLKLLGIWGLIMGPITVIIFITLQKINLIPTWKQK
ncbi:sporulation integral membrane protein YtvI [Clostridiaceae bacterium 35-E11]